jgi:hypothetical protein
MSNEEESISLIPLVLLRLFPKGHVGLIYRYPVP